MMNLLLIQQADVYAPAHLGKMDVLIGQGKILKMQNIWEPPAEICPLKWSMLRA